MRSLDAVRLMLERSNTTPYRAAVSMGRSPTYVSSMLRRGSVPSADILSEIARACGYRLDLVPLDGSEAIHIDGGGAG